MRRVLFLSCALGACSGGKTPCVNDMPGPGAGCGLSGTWHAGSGDKAIDLVLTDSTFSGTMGGVAVTGSYTISGSFGCNATFTVGTDVCTMVDADAGTTTGAYGIAVGGDCNTFSLSAQTDPCIARVTILDGAQLKKQQ